VGIEPLPNFRDHLVGPYRHVNHLVVDADLYLLDDSLVAVADEEKEYLLGEVVRILRERGAVVVVTSRARPNINASPVDLRKFSTFCLK